MPGHLRRRRTQRSSTTPICPSGGDGTGRWLCRSSLQYTRVWLRRCFPRRRRARHKRDRNYEMRYLGLQTWPGSSSLHRSNCRSGLQPQRLKSTDDLAQSNWRVDGTLSHERFREGEPVAPSLTSANLPGELDSSHSEAQTQLDSRTEWQLRDLARIELDQHPTEANVERTWRPDLLVYCDQFDTKPSIFKVAQRNTEEPLIGFARGRFRLRAFSSSYRHQGTSVSEGACANLAVSRESARSSRALAWQESTA